MADLDLLDPPALADHLLAGGIAGFPTDTVPALAALPAAAVPLWELKRRPVGKPFILMGATAGELLEALGQPPPEGWEGLARRGWPGALTLVLPARGAVAEALNPRGCTLGLRVPACSPALALLRCTGPLATTSANHSGEPPRLTPDAIAEAFPGLPLAGPLPWPVGSGQASTVIAWEEAGSSWRMLRQGELSPAALGLPWPA